MAPDFSHKWWNKFCGGGGGNMGEQVLCGLGWIKWEKGSFSVGVRGRWGEWISDKSEVEGN